MKTLRSRSDFARVFKGQKMEGGTSVFFYSKTAEQPRIGIIIRKKFGSAPERNRAKRIIKTIVSFFQIPGYDVVVSVRIGSIFEFGSFKQDYLKLWRKLNKC